MRILRRAGGAAGGSTRSREVGPPSPVRGSKSAFGRVGDEAGRVEPRAATGPARLSCGALMRWGLEVLGQELQRALPRQPCAGLVVASPLVAVEAVPGRIDVHRQIGMSGSDPRMMLRRNGLIGLAPMEQHRAARLLRGRVGDAAAVVAHRACHAVDTCGRQPGQRAAEAIADDADLEPLGRQGLDGCANVLDGVLDGKFPPDGAATLDILGLVANGEVALDAVEDGRRQRDIAISREAIGDPFDMRVDAEDLLHDDKPAARRPLGRHAIGGKLVAVLGRERDGLSHWCAPQGVAVSRSMVSRRSAVLRMTPPGSRAYAPAAGQVNPGARGQLPESAWPNGPTGAARYGARSHG